LLCAFAFSLISTCNNADLIKKGAAGRELSGMEKHQCIVAMNFAIPPWLCATKKEFNPKAAHNAFQALPD
jgi:hypothetical protein